MRFVKTTLMSIGAIALFASLITMVAPKAVRGAAAALVQVTNTVAAPAITQSVPTLASQIVNLSCEALTEGSTPCQVTGTGLTFTIPAGQHFVATVVELKLVGGGETASFILESDSNPTFLNEEWFYASDGMTHDFLLSPGVVFPAGTVSSAGTFGQRARVYGYLTAN